MTGANKFIFVHYIFYLNRTWSCDLHKYIIYPYVRNTTTTAPSTSTSTITTTATVTNLLNNTNSTSIYYVSVSTATWYQAKINCQKMNGTLVVINSQAEYDSLKPILNRLFYFNAYWVNSN